MATTEAPVYPEKIDAAVLKVAGVVVIGAIMSILDITVVNVALPTFQVVFGEPGEPLPYSTVAWTVTAYTLALATVIPMTGWAADRFGTKRLYLTALALFTGGSVLCATADSIDMLIVFRVIQGLGGGMLMPLGMTIMTRAAGPARMGRLMAILGVPMLLGPILGPILGGWLIDNASWHWIFLINVPIGIIAFVYAFVVLASDSPEPSESFDFLGMLLLSPGLALFLFGVSSLPQNEGDFTAPQVWVSMLAGVLLMLAFVWHAFRPEHPLLDLRLYKNRNLTVSSITMFLFAAAFFGGLLLVPTYFQQIRGESTLAAGLLIAPQGIGAMITMPIAGNLVDRIPVGRIVPFGLVLIAIGFAGFTQIESDTSYGLIISMLFIMGLGMGGDDDAAVHHGLAHPHPPRSGAWLDVAEHHPADRQLGRRCGHLRHADQPAQAVRPRPAGHRGPDGPRDRRSARPGRSGPGSGGGSRGVREHLLVGVRPGAAHVHPRLLPAPQARGEPPARRRGSRAGRPALSKVSPFRHVGASFRFVEHA